MSEKRTLEGNNSLEAESSCVSVQECASGCFTSGVSGDS